MKGGTLSKKKDGLRLSCLRAACQPRQQVMRTRANPSKTYSVSMHCSARGSHSLIGCWLFLLPLIIRPGGGAESGVDTTRPGQAGAHGRGSSSRRRTFGRMPCGAADIRAVSFELALDLLGVKVDNADRAVIRGQNLRSVGENLGV